MKQPFTKWGVVALVGISVMGCGRKKKDPPPGIIHEENKGCVQGVVVDGITGERLDLSGAEDAVGVRVLVANRVIHAYKHDQSNANMKGEYFACGIPVENDYPILAIVDGYETVESRIKIDSTIQQRTAGTEAGDIKNNYPTTLADIVMFPKGTETNDLKFTVVSEGSPVPDAQIQLKPLGTNILRDKNGVPTAGAPQPAVAQNALLPLIRLTPTSMKTGLDGVAVFPANDLVLGGQYQYFVVPASGASTLALSQGVVTAGYRTQNGAALATNPAPYEVIVNMDAAIVKLSIVSQSKAFNVDGKITLLFNKPIEVAPSGDLGFGAVLQGAQTGKLREEGARASANYTISGNRLELSPVYDKRPEVEKDFNAKILFNGLTVRAVGATVSEDYFDIQNISIGLFR